MNLGEHIAFDGVDQDLDFRPQEVGTYRRENGLRCGCGVYVYAKMQPRRMRRGALARLERLQRSGGPAFGV